MSTETRILGLTPRSRQSTIRVSETAGLAALFEPHVNAVVVERHGQPVLRRYAADVASGASLAFQGTASFKDDGGLNDLDALARLLPADDARDVMLQDIAYWIEVMTELTDAAGVGIRLLQLRGPMCPGFHVDRVPLRLICTYAGPTTEWLPASAVDPQAMSVPRIAPEAIRRDAKIESCAPLDVLVLKGSTWPGNERRGAIHRSPPVHSPRLLLTMDLLD